MNTELHDKIKPEYELDYASLSIFIGLIGIVGGLFWYLSNEVPNHHSTAPLAVTLENNTNEERVEPSANPFDAISIEAGAAIVYDSAQNEILYAKNEETQLPLASITKLMTIAATAPYISPNETIVIEDSSLYEEGDSGLFANEEWNAKDLIDFTLLVSSNDGADVLANVAGAAKLVRGGSESTTPEAAFIDEMNAIAKEIGLQQTYFINGNWT